MKIISIFEEELYSIQYKNEKCNEYDRLMELWTNVAFLHGFAKTNKVADVDNFIIGILRETEVLQDLLEEIHFSHNQFGLYFEPLQESERKKEKLPFQKGKIKKKLLRLYAVKLDTNCFIISGGAIKMSQKMEDHPDTAMELKKLKKTREYLNQNGVYDNTSFFELINDDL
jgi:hypothetical protein